MGDRLHDKHLQRLVKILSIKLAQRCHKLTKTKKQQILTPTIRRLAKYRADVYMDNEREVIKELEFLCGLK